jgi:hypothetical protein
LFPVLGGCSDDLIPFWIDVSSSSLNALRGSIVVFTVVGVDSFFKLHGCGCSSDLDPSSLNAQPCTLCTCIRPHLYHRIAVLLADLVQSFNSPSAAAKSTSSSHRLQHRAPSYITSEDSSTKFTVIWCGCLLWLHRALYNRRFTRSLRSGVRASGTPATHRRRDRDLPAVAIVFIQSMDQFVIQPSLRGPFCKMLA